MCLVLACDPTLFTIPAILCIPDVTHQWLIHSPCLCPAVPSRAAPLFSFTKFVEDRLILAWRAYLTRYLLHIYLKDKAFFQLALAQG